MKNKQKVRFFRILSWEDIRNDVYVVNPTIAKIIDEANPCKHFKLIEASYAYGDLILKDGLAQLPTPEKLIPSNSTELNTETKALLSYRNIPLFLTLENDNEVFVDTSTRIVPLNLFHAGSILGAFEAADFIFDRESTARWSVSAGSRSIFTLPKINDNLGLKRLRSHYNFDSVIRVNDLSDHFDLFKAIAQSEHFKQPWRNRVLFFSQEWLKDPRLIGFQKYILQQAWLQAQFAIGKTELGLQSEKFIEIISSRNIKPHPYIIDNAKHLLYIASKRMPAFRPSNNLQYAAPTQEIQNSLTEIYRIEKHYPTMLHVCSLEDINSHPIYYSLSYQTLLEGSPINPSSSTIMLDLKEIKFLFDTLKQRGKNSTIIEHIINNIEFDYFHIGTAQDNEIKSSFEIPNEDLSFMPATNQNNLSFCYSSKFWKGCVRITLK